MEQRGREILKENGVNDAEDLVSEPTNTNAIQLMIVNQQITRPKRSKSKFDETQYKCTTENVATMLMRVLE